MNTDPLSLSSLEDIALTAPPPFWPPAPGFWVLLLLLTGVIAVSLFYWYAYRQVGAYRRAGLILLAAAGSGREIDIVLKRVGLAAFPRETVAPLYGEEWGRFLDATCSRCEFGRLFSGSEPPLLEPYRQCAAQWIKYHTTTIPC